MGLFEQDTALESLGNQRWQGELTDNWCIGNVPNGGYVLAIAGKALSAALPHKDPMSVNAFYLAPTVVGPVICEVEPLRQGGSTSFAMVRLYQNDELKVQVTAAYCDVDALSGETQVHVEPANLLLPEECVQLTPLPHIKMGRQIYQWVTPGQEESLSGKPQGQGRWDGWIDFRDNCRKDLFSLLYFTDAFPPPVFGYYGPTGWVPTVELSVQVRAKPAQGPIRCQFVSRMMTNGLTEEDGILWDCEGKLVAISRQTAKFRLPR